MKINTADLIKKLNRPVYIANGIDPKGIDRRLVAHTDKDSQIAEQYRILQTYLYAFANTANAETSFKSLAITSSQAQEGKTITSCNLAITLASSGNKKVVLVDCDLRKPEIHTMLNMDRSPGVSDIINGKASADKILKSPVIDNLYVLPAGSEIANAYEALRHQETKKLIEMLRSSFDYVIIDTPPVMPVSDSGIVGALCDAVILVARSDRTSKKTARDAFRLLTMANIKPIGCILTDYQAAPHHYARYSRYYNKT